MKTKNPLVPSTLSQWLREKMCDMSGHIEKAGHLPQARCCRCGVRVDKFASKNVSKWHLPDYISLRNGN